MIYVMLNSCLSCDSLTLQIDRLFTAEIVWTVGVPVMLPATAFSILGRLLSWIGYLPGSDLAYDLLSILPVPIPSLNSFPFRIFKATPALVLYGLLGVLSGLKFDSFRIFTSPSLGVHTTTQDAIPA